MVQAHIFVSGFVQGVGYRYFVLKNAQKLHLTGWVKNLDDGQVEAVLQGSKENVKKMILLCKAGPFLSEVKYVAVEWEDAQKLFKEFKIDYMT